MSSNKDDVTNPAHYTDGSVEFIHAVEAALGPEGFLSFCQGNAMKYLWRCNRKGKPFQDVSKAHWYICRWLEAHDRQHPKKPHSGDVYKSVQTCTESDGIDVIWSGSGTFTAPSDTE